MNWPVAQHLTKWPESFCVCCTTADHYRGKPSAWRRFQTSYFTYVPLRLHLGNYRDSFTYISSKISFKTTSRQLVVHSIFNRMHRCFVHTKTPVISLSLYSNERIIFEITEIYYNTFHVDISKINEINLVIEIFLCKVFFVSVQFLEYMYYCLC